MINKMPTPKQILTACVIALAAIWFILVCSGCMTDRKAANQANSLIEKKPLVVLPIFRGKFPCVTTKADTSITWKDTVINIDCPEVQPVPAGEYFTIRDTITKTLTKTVRVPVTLPVQIKEITKTVMDSSYGKELAINLTKATDKANALQADKDRLQQARNKWRLWFFILAGFNAVWFFGKPFLRLIKLPV